MESDEGIFVNHVKKFRLLDNHQRVGSPAPGQNLTVDNYRGLPGRLRRGKVPLPYLCWVQFFRETDVWDSGPSPLSIPWAKHTVSYTCISSPSIFIRGLIIRDFGWGAFQVLLLFPYLYFDSDLFHPNLPPFLNPSPQVHKEAGTFWFGLLGWFLTSVLGPPDSHLGLFHARERSGVFRSQCLSFCFLLVLLQ